MISAGEIRDPLLVPFAKSSCQDMVRLLRASRGGSAKTSGHRIAQC